MLGMTGPQSSASCDEPADFSLFSECTFLQSDPYCFCAVVAIDVRAQDAKLSVPGGTSLHIPFTDEDHYSVTVTPGCMVSKPKKSALSASRAQALSIKSLIRTQGAEDELGGNKVRARLDVDVSAPGLEPAPGALTTGAFCLRFQFLCVGFAFFRRCSRLWASLFDWYNLVVPAVRDPLSIGLGAFPVRRLQLTLPIRATVSGVLTTSAPPQ